VYGGEGYRFKVYSDKPTRALLNKVTSLAPIQRRANTRFHPTAEKRGG